MTGLAYEARVPVGVRDGAPLVVLLHGRGSDRYDLLPLASHFPSDLIVLTPEAPFPAAPWGYGPGSAWYRFLGGRRPDPEDFETAQQALERFLDEVPEELPVRVGPIVLGGFSQGGTMSLGFSLRHPGRVASVLNFSGFVPDHPSVQVTPETVQGTRFFWGHGKRDPAVPFSHAAEGRAMLSQAGAALAVHDHTGGHWIGPDELKHALRWLSAGGARAAP